VSGRSTLPVHLRGRPWLYYVYGPAEHHHGQTVRHDLFGAANYTGAFATLIVVALFATSNDYSVRALGTRQWKQFQRWNYVAAALVVMHAFGYQAIEKQHSPFVVVVIACVAMTLAMQCRSSDTTIGRAQTVLRRYQVR
jgi:methionine sulfoxide reductase heme-binding subunit